MADSIEATLRNHSAGVRVNGGAILPTHIKFHALPYLGTKISRIKALAADGLLGTSAQVLRRGAHVVIMVRRQEATTLDGLLDDIEPVRFTAALGIRELDDGSCPLLVNLESKSQAGAHILVIGQERDELLTIMTKSLRRWNGPETLQVSWIDGEGSLAVNTVARHKETRPVLVLLTNGDGITPALRDLMARKVRNGVHVIMSTDYADDGLRELFPCRIRGLGGGHYEAVAEDWAGTFYTPEIEAQPSIQVDWPINRLAQVFAND